MKNVKTKQDRSKHTVYTDKDPDVEEMIRRLMSDGRTFSTFAIKSLRRGLVEGGYADNKWHGKSFSKTKCV